MWLVFVSHRRWPLEDGQVGPGPTTLRRPDNRRSWRGLSVNEATLLAVWLASHELHPDEVYTHVPVGPVAGGEAEYEDSAEGRMARAIYPRRIDAVLRFGERWWLVEAKVAASHQALGQVLLYRHLWGLGEGLPVLEKVVVLTDVLCSDCRSAYRAHGVEIVEVGGLFDWAADDLAERRAGGFVGV